MPTEITVRGTFSAFQAPERGTVHAMISYEGPQMQPVYEQVARDLDAVQASLDFLKSADSEPVTWWSTQQLRTTSRRPWNQDGVQLPLVHAASVNVEAKFQDFTELSRWVGTHISETPGFRVARVEWALTVQRRDELRQQVRARAVLDAAVRAQQYADALGLGKIRPVAIADAGMLEAHLRPETGGGGSHARALAATTAGAPEMELMPEDIEVAAAVDARFVVGD